MTHDLTVTIREQQYQFAGLGDLELLPLAEVYGEPAPENESSEEFLRWKQKLSQQLRDRRIREVLAEFLKSAFPDLPDSIVKYKRFALPDGRQEIEVALKIDADELLLIMKALHPVFEAKNKKAEQFEQKLQKPVKAIAQSKGFKKTSEEIALRRKELLAELAILE